MPEQVPPGEWIRRYCQLAGGGGILCRHVRSLLIIQRFNPLMMRDLGVVVHKSLKVSNQCNKVVKEAYSVLGVINRCFINKTKDILVPLYKALVRSPLQYCILTWWPYLLKDIELMEKVQKSMTRMLPELKGVSYPERLEVKTWRLTGDLMEVLKIVKCLDNIDKNIFSRDQLDIVHGTVRNCIKSSFKLDIRKYSFSQRVINHWNALTRHAVDCNTVSSFKRCLDRYTEDRES